MHSRGQNSIKLHKELIFPYYMKADTCLLTEVLLDLGESWLKLPVLSIPGNVIIMLGEEAVLCSHYAHWS